MKPREDRDAGEFIPAGRLLQVTGRCDFVIDWTLAKREEKQSIMSIFCPMERGRRTRRREPRVVALNNRPIEPEPPPELKARGFPFQQELAAQRLQDPLDAHPVFDDA